MTIKNKMISAILVSLIAVTASANESDADINRSSNTDINDIQSSDEVFVYKKEVEANDDC